VVADRFFFKLSMGGASLRALLRMRFLTLTFSFGNNDDKTWTENLGTDGTFPDIHPARSHSSDILVSTVDK